MKDTWKPVLNDVFKLERFDNEILLYSMTDTRAVYLNDTAAVVCGMCGSGQSVREIVALLKEAYPAQKNTIRDDVITALSQLVEKEVLILRD